MSLGEMISHREVQYGFQERLEGHNGGGDPYNTDGRLAIGVVGLGYVPAFSAPGEEE